MNETLSLKKALDFLGLCKRAGRVTSGVETCIEKVRNGKAMFFLLDESVSDNTRKRVMESCAYYHVPLYLLPKGTLGHAIGQPGKFTAVLPTDGMAEKFAALLDSASEITKIHLEFSPRNAGNS